jgi:hypothetical protein
VRYTVIGVQTEIDGDTMCVKSDFKGPHQICVVGKCYSFLHTSTSFYTVGF